MKYISRYYTRKNPLFESKNMNGLRIFISDFFQNKGHYVFLSLLIAKICGFLSALIIIRILPEHEFGTVSIVASIFAIFAPFSGFGSHQSLLRFGSLTSDSVEKKDISTYLFRKGFYYQLLLSVIFLFVSIFYVNKYEEIFYIFLLFAVRLIGFYFLNYIQSEFRIFGNNRNFARVNNVVNISGLLFLFIFSYFFGLMGYLVAIAIAPFFALFWFKKEHFKHAIQRSILPKREIWTYGLYGSGTALLSDALFSVDVLMLSFLMNETAVANYKVAILIPANITFLAATFMQSDYPVLAKNYRDKAFLKNYILNYYKIFVPIAIIIFIVGFLLKSQILQFFFSDRYSENTLLFALFLAGFCTNMLLRNLYGNLLSAVGKMKYNTFISALNVLLVIVFSLFLVRKIGLQGMAISMVGSMILCGFLFLFSFHYYYKNLK